MTNKLLTLLRFLIALTPFIILAIWNFKTNLKKKIRSRQLPMPLLAFIYCIVILILLNRLNGIIEGVILGLPQFFANAADWFRSILNGNIAFIGGAFDWLSNLVSSIIRRFNMFYLVFFAENALIIFVHILLKRLMIDFIGWIFSKITSLHEAIASRFYEYDSEDDAWFVKRNFAQARTFLKTAYIASIVIACLVVYAGFMLYRRGWLTTVFLPVFSVIIIGEIFFAIDGLTKNEAEQLKTPDQPIEDEVCDYHLIRPELKRLFEDKLNADDMTVAQEDEAAPDASKSVADMMEDERTMIEAYGVFMNGKQSKGLEIDLNYLNSGRDLLLGKSILFNNPFYYDLIPYAFYAMNRNLLKHRKALIVLGRHEIEDEIAEWVRCGLQAVNNIPFLWNIGVLSAEENDFDIGIVTRSKVHDLGMHEKNVEFFASVGYVVLIEPSRLLTTAQLGLNSIIRCCRARSNDITYCSVDKNCDGLLDALSHILMKSLTEVSATNHHSGVSTYMSWSPDDTHLIHRMLPNVARYLGFGTELSFVGLRNNAKVTHWYGGDAFPVMDQKWIAGQYYYDLLKYAKLPITQDEMSARFKASASMWSARIGKYQYLVVEDESNNLFEVRRNYSTRATKQGFVNVISPEYLLKDYMVDNSGIFITDAKAIPCIVADYAHTVRNVTLRLCLRLCTGYLKESEIKRELMLINIDAEDPVAAFWHELCLNYSPSGIPKDADGNELLITEQKGIKKVFTSEIIVCKRCYDSTLGAMINTYSICDELFAALFVSDLQSASYIAEDENGENLYLGTELNGHIFQKYCPGQFFTFNGKYYEMLRVTGDGNVIVRRAADHINGRPGYRQVREYALSNLRASDTMGDIMDVSGMRVEKVFGDITVDTPAYWELPKYNDFVKGKSVMVNGIPQRTYHNKQLLKITLPDIEGMDGSIIKTLAVLVNEVFRTLFAENADYIVAVTPGKAEIPGTFSLDCKCEDSNCIYIIEDSQLDIGLLESCSRNIKRILFTACDYLDWHIEKFEKSINTPSDEPQGGLVPAEDDPNAADPNEEKKKKGIFGFLKRFWEWLKRLFRKLFGRKKKDEPPAGPVGEPVSDGTDGEPASDGTDGEPWQDPTDKGGTASDDGSASEHETDADSAGDADGQGILESDPDSSAEGKALSSRSQMLFSAALGMSSAQSPETRASSSDEGELGIPTDKGISGDDDLEFEPDNAVDGGSSFELKRKPYHERCYLLYGGTDYPAGLNLTGALNYLKALGFANGELEQARKGRSIAQLIESGYTGDQGGIRCCDFCGTRIVGTDYERLADGRERCRNCSRTTIKSLNEFKKMFNDVRENMRLFFGAEITVPIEVKMVNAKKINKISKRRFVPTAGFNPRILGYAQQIGNKFKLYVENGAPRYSSIMTMTHELTHIWQYEHWDRDQIAKRYGKDHELEIYEGMATWTEIQYAFYIGETEVAARTAIADRHRDDEYGRGFVMFEAVYPLTESTSVSMGKNPFSNDKKPI